MAHLATLKIVNKPTFNPQTAEERKRHKLIVKLQEQNLNDFQKQSAVPVAVPTSFTYTCVEVK